MKNCQQVLEFFGVENTQLNLQPGLVIAGLSNHSQQIQPGELFVATAGSNQHRNQFWPAAKAQGAVGLLTDQPLQDADLPVILVPDLAAKLAEFASWFYDFPSKKLQLIGITGTNGKTSTAHFIAQLLTNLNRPTALLGTLGNGQLGKLQASANTTMDQLNLQKTLAEFASQQIEFVVMEVSSHAISLGRIAGVEFDCLALTQVASDHLDFHQDLAAYQQTKASLFLEVTSKYQLLNLDDQIGAELVIKLASNPGLLSYGCSPAADLQLLQISSKAGVLEFGFNYQNQQYLLQPGLVLGDFNAENILCALGCLLQFGFKIDDLLRSAAKLQPIAGRLQNVNTVKPITALVDFAHTADALQQLLQTVKNSIPADARLWLVFGCGGDRDTSKRPQMGKIAAQMADFVVLTSDNPRSEDPQQIIDQILAGTETVSETAQNSAEINVILDRKQAIEFALAQTRPGDWLLVAGKGHENYQEIQGARYPFSDQQVLADFYLWSAADLASWSAGELRTRNPQQLIDLNVNQVSTDSRNTRPGSAYIAICGENFDGHDFAAAAVEQGANLLIVSKLLELDCPQLLVADTRLALGQIAKHHQRKIRQQGGLQKLIAITGSNGKTTVKTLLAHVLSQQGKTLATQGNLNNDFGVPRTLLELRPSDEWAVIEMGANHPQEIEYLTSLAEPDIALITLAAGAHLEGFGSLDGVIQAKGEIFTGLQPQGIGIVNTDSAGFANWQQQIQQLPTQLTSWSFGSLANANLQILSSQASQQKGKAGMEFKFKFQEQILAGFVPLLGEHNVYNTAAVSTICLALGLDWQQIMPGIASFAGVAGRLVSHQLQNQNLLIDDSYNANPNSVKAAIDVLATRPGYKILVLGQMAELGADASKQHLAIGRYAQQQKIDLVLGFGELSRQVLQGFDNQLSAAREPQTHQQLVDFLIDLLTESTATTILVKGSRSAQMELVVQPILARFNNALSS